MGAARRAAPIAQTAGTKPRPQQSTEQQYRCLTVSVDDENTSKLWTDLAKFAFALADEDTTPERAEIMLDRAAHAVQGLDSEAAWSSAGRYFQAENFHAFERPACARAYRLRAAGTPSP
jgi:hypothetical protein